MGSLIQAVSSRAMMMVVMMTVMMMRRRRRIPMPIPMGMLMLWVLVMMVTMMVMTGTDHDTPECPDSCICNFYCAVSPELHGYCRSPARDLLLNYRNPPTVP